MHQEIHYLAKKIVNNERNNVVLMVCLCPKKTKERPLFLLILKICLVSNDII